MIERGPLDHEGLLVIGMDGKGKALYLPYIPS